MCSRFPLSLLYICLEICAKMNILQIMLSSLPAELIEKIEIARSRKVLVFSTFYPCFVRNKFKCITHATDKMNNIIEYEVTHENLMSILERCPTPLIESEYSRIIKWIKKMETYTAKMNALCASTAELFEADTATKIKIMENICHKICAGH